jgi:hypothetical protein
MLLPAAGYNPISPGFVLPEPIEIELPARILKVEAVERFIVDGLEYAAYIAGLVMVLPINVTAVCASALPLKVAPLFIAINV